MDVPKSTPESISRTEQSYSTQAFSMRWIGGFIHLRIFRQLLASPDTTSRARLDLEAAVRFALSRMTGDWTVAIDLTELGPIDPRAQSGFRQIAGSLETKPLRRALVVDESPAAADQVLSTQVATAGAGPLRVFRAEDREAMVGYLLEPGIVDEVELRSLLAATPKP